MITLIYRKSDRSIVGFVHPPHRVEVELANILRSELKGRKRDYATVEVEEWPQGHQAVINPDGTVTMTPLPQVDYPGEYAAAATDTERVDVIARSLGLI